MKRRLAHDGGVVAVELALIMAALTPAIIAGSDLLVKLLQREQDYVACSAQMVPGAPWPEVCTRFLPSDVAPPDVVPGVPAPAPSPEVTP